MKRYIASETAYFGFCDNSNMPAFAFTIFVTEAIIANIYLAFHLPSIVLNALFLTNWILIAAGWGRHCLFMFYEPSHAELSNLPEDHDWPSQCQNSGRSLWGHFVATTLPPMPAQTNEASLCGLYMVLPPFSSLRVGFSLWIFIQRKSFTFIDNLNSQYSSYSPC